MYNEDTELLFPMRVAAQLRDLRGNSWRELINRITSPDASLLDQSAFTLLMVQMNNCLGCSADSFRGMRGCTQCARLNVRRSRAQDDDLLAQFEQCRKEVHRFLQQGTSDGTQTTPD